MLGHKNKVLHAGLNQGLKILAYPANESGIYVAIHHNLDVPLMGVKRKFIPLGSENNAKVKIEAVKDHGGSWCFDNEEDENGKPMPIIVQGDPNKPRAKFIPPSKSKDTKDNNNKKHKTTKG